MKVLMINGSPHVKGNTYVALHEMEKVFAAEGIDTELVMVRNQDIRGCIACRSCVKKGKCVFDDIVNTLAPKFEAADGLVVGSPVYYASANATLIACLDRLFFSTPFDKTMKVGAAVAAARRGGLTATFDELNKYFAISGMPIATGQYWNGIHGREIGEANEDAEGLQMMRTLARNMTFLMGVTVFQYLVFTFMPGLLGIGLAGTEFMWPQKEMHILGVDFTWSLLGYNVLYDANGAVMIGGGLGYFISYETGSFLAQCINFPLQRNITFKSKRNPVYQAMWYLIAWITISLICNGFNNLWMPIASVYVAPAVYNLLVTFVTGGVSMVIFFFVFKIIFPEGKPEKE